ncbi:MAG: thioredoxin domain-containing protein, partial [Burkholderiales bacterium]
SVDERWLVPHFEKMLYDNAQLLELLALAHARSGNPLFRRRAQETVGWLAREMTTTEGMFCASLDADSEGEEGKFYVWSLAEVQQVLGDEDAEFFAAQYDATAQGNFEGHTILNRLKATAHDAETEARLAPMRAELLGARAKRVRPGLDDKVLADWNGMMIAALVNAGVLLGEPTWRDMAARAFIAIASKMSRGDRLGHSWRDGRLLFPGLASDLAHMIRAALALHEATGERDYLERALAWQGALDRHYANTANAGYFLTADDAEGLVVRPSATTDDATPNPNAIAAQNIVRLSLTTGHDQWRQQADRLFDGLLPLAGDNLFMHVALLNALDLRLRATEIVIAGAGPRADALTDAALKQSFLDRIVLRAPSADALPPDHPAQEKLKAVAEPSAFICMGETCSLPVTTPDEIAQRVNSVRA